MRPWKQGLPRCWRNYHAWGCRTSAQLNTKFETSHKSAVLFEILLPHYYDWPQPLQHEIPFYFKFRVSVLISKTWYKLKQTFSEKISTKNSCFSISLRAVPYPDIHVPFTGSSSQYFFADSKNVWSTSTLKKWNHQQIKINISPESGDCSYRK